jgi:hypothetical protein
LIFLSTSWVKLRYSSSELVRRYVPDSWSRSFITFFRNLHFILSSCVWVCSEGFGPNWSKMTALNLYNQFYSFQECYPFLISCSWCSTYTIILHPKWMLLLCCSHIAAQMNVSSVL